MSTQRTVCQNIDFSPFTYPIFYHVEAYYGSPIFLSGFSISPMPRSRKDASVSKPTTSKPLAADVCAMPCPINPRPITPTFLISGAAVESAAVWAAAWVRRAHAARVVKDASMSCKKDVARKSGAILQNDCLLRFNKPWRPLTQPPSKPPRTYS